MARVFIGVDSPQAVAVKRRMSDAVHRRLRADAAVAAAGPGGHSGAAVSPASAGSTRTTALRISHFPDPHHDATRAPTTARKTQLEATG